MLVHQLLLKSVFIPNYCHHAWVWWIHSRVCFLSRTVLTLLESWQFGLKNIRGFIIWCFSLAVVIWVDW